MEEENHDQYSGGIELTGDSVSVAKTPRRRRDIMHRGGVTGYGRYESGRRRGKHITVSTMRAAATGGEEPALPVLFVVFYTVYLEREVK